MAGQRNRIRRQRARARTEAATAADSPGPEKASPSSGSSGSSGTSSDRDAQRKIPLSKLNQSSPQEEQEEPRGIRHVRSLRWMLLAQIRDYYLDAISRLPTAELNTTLARGLLIAGHCYGPLHPVDNIVLNSIWYSAAFPLRSSDRIDVNVINDTAISRAVQRSLDGLVAALRHHYPGLSHEDALWHLSLSGADLRAAVASVRGVAPSLFSPAESEAFQAAAKAARHPKPAALALFASSVTRSLEREAASMLNNKRRLSSADILRLSAMVLPSPQPDELPHPPLQERCMEAFQIIERRRNNLIRWYRPWVEIADAALRKYAHQTAAHYELHIIYGLGTLKEEVDMHMEDKSFHVNFMAWPKDSSSTREAPAFFFAEALNQSGPCFCEEDITLCCKVQPSSSEVDCCHYCLTKNFRIDHPDNYENFDGGQYFKMDGISADWDCPVALDVDYRCFDPDRDVDLVEYLDQDYARYVSSSSWRCRHKKMGSVIGYCSGIM